ncbi:DUF4231 domain-containing protein [Bradyrhizobium sp. BRP22]|uniref:DUF4231 domain-containing protein n=1 Tax=Bradyrhizobium sp. BRP22 TaxID=2793821 RepID=UPI001CD723E4|nr:DUF4231 domain-containing protein [Bradyrhizobium sp. BRP22]MCA1456978.1 DUF4231 domain-containing protein [Bradyrhizobium sp. BRP22]
MIALTETADRQLVWSKTAGALKKNVDLARWSTFLLSILGALLTTIAGQLDQPRPRLYLAIAGAVVLAIMTFLSSRLLSGTQVTDWIRARAASEALKREAYKYAARAAPYEDPMKRDAVLNDERDRIEQDVDDLAGLQVATAEPSTLPLEDLTRAEYLKRRVREQISYYHDKAGASRHVAKIMRWSEFMLALAATVITAGVGIAGKEVFGVKFDFVTITAVLTTITGAILAHIEASRYDFLVTTYHATARRLQSELAKMDDPDGMSTENWSTFVQHCESILSEENTNWAAKWTKP